jgi:predicted MFS family arabinose efflux permease
VEKHRWAILLNVTLVFGMFAYIPYLNVHLVKNVGIEEKDLSLLYLVGGIFTIVGSRLTGRLSDRYGKLEVFQVAAALALIPIIAVANLPVLPLWGVIAFSSSFMVLMNARYVPATSLMTSAARADMRGSFLSASASLQHLAMSTASLLGGVIVAAGAEPGEIRMPRVGWLAATLGLCAIPIARRLRRLMDEVGPRGA